MEQQAAQLCLGVQGERVGCHRASLTAKDIGGENQSKRHHGEQPVQTETPSAPAPAKAVASAVSETGHLGWFSDEALRSSIIIAHG